MPQSTLRPIPRILFMSRWLQLPLYLGLIVAQGVYVWYFLISALAIPAVDRTMPQSRPHAAIPETADIDR